MVSDTPPSNGSTITFDRLLQLVNSGPAALFWCQYKDGILCPRWAGGDVKGLTGWSQEDVVRESDWWRGGLHEEDRDGVLGRLVTLLEDKVQVHEYRFRCRDGGYHWIHDEMRVMAVTGTAEADVVRWWFNVTDRKEAELALQIKQAQIRAQYDTIPYPVYTWRKLGNNFVLIDGNVAADEFTSTRIEDLIGRIALHVFGDENHIVEDMHCCFNEQRSITREMPYRRRATGELRDLVVTYAFGPPDLVLTHIVDVTETKALENQIRQKQKMETLGGITGGVAHEFNNVLQGIIGNAELLADVVRDAEDKEAVEGILAGAERGTDFTSSLLSFSRRQRLDPAAIEVSDAFQELLAIARSAIPVSVTLKTTLADDVWPVKVDRGQFQSTLLNLCLNARDALPKAGHIELAAENLIKEEEEAQGGEAPQRREFVAISVADNGVGMTEEEILRCFEPFYSTKNNSKGTGLGLSMVYGFAQQSGGTCEVASTVGAGTTVTLVLPRGEEPLTGELIPVQDETVIKGEGTVLIVEDDDIVRRNLEHAIRRLGYRVVVAGDETQALDMLAAAHVIDVILTDVVIPGRKSGFELVDDARKRFPNIGVVYMSGYSDETLMAIGMQEPNSVFLHKPFRIADLSSALAKAAATHPRSD